MAGTILPTVRDYNLDQDAVTVTLPDGRSLTYQYLPNGTLDRIETPDGPITFSYVPATGELASVSAPSGLLTTYVRDGALVTDEVYSGLFTGTVHFEHDAFLRVVREDVNGGHSVDLEYDLDGIATRVGSMSLVPRTDNGILASTTLLTVADALTYNGYGEVEGYQATVSGTPRYGRSDARDSLGRIYESVETIAGTGHTFSYSYDFAGRLTSVVQDGLLAFDYAYDGNDNRIRVTTPLGTRTATVDAQDRLLAFGDWTFGYNTAGQTTSRTHVPTSATRQYGYDAQGNLTFVDLGASRIDYDVDGVGRRVARWSNNVLDTTYLWGGGRIVASVGASGTLTRYVYATNGTAPDYFTRAGRRTES